MRQPDAVEKGVFERLSRQEQVDTLHAMISYVRSEQANDKKIFIEMRNQIAGLEKTVDYLRGELKGIGMRGPQEESVSTSQKIQAVMEKRFAFWRPIVQNALSMFVNTVLIALLYLAFGGKIP